MNDKQIRRLRQFYQSLKGQQRVLDNATYIDDTAARVFATECMQIQQEFPGLLPSFNLREFYNGSSYELQGIRSYIAIALGRLKGEIDDSSSTPVTEQRDFTFIHDSDLRHILERDFYEIQRAFISQCWKSVIILCGGAIEAILTDLLLANESQAKASGRASKAPDITRWDLSDLINVAVDLKLVTPGVEKLSHPIREYRNLVHPGNEIRNKLTFNAEEARIALEVLNIVYRDLSP
jgi:hypothetical protein